MISLEYLWFDSWHHLVHLIWACVLQLTLSAHLEKSSSSLLICATIWTDLVSSVGLLYAWICDIIWLSLRLRSATLCCLSHQVRGTWTLHIIFRVCNLVVSNFWASCRRALLLLLHLHRRQCRSWLLAVASILHDVVVVTFSRTETFPWVINTSRVGSIHVGKHSTHPLIAPHLACVNRGVLASALIDYRGLLRAIYWFTRFYIQILHALGSIISQGEGSCLACCSMRCNLIWVGMYRLRLSILSLVKFILGCTATKRIMCLTLLLGLELRENILWHVSTGFLDDALSSYSFVMLRWLSRTNLLCVWYLSSLQYSLRCAIHIHLGEWLQFTLTNLTR